MSAPTPAPGDESPREGYYPDPSIPGYVRYWNGASWVPGTSRPAPQQGDPAPAAPAGGAGGPQSTAPVSASADAPVDETGPVFLDEEPFADNRPEPATAWQADASRQTGFGGEHDRRVSWGGTGHPGAQDPRGEPSGPSGPEAGRDRADRLPAVRAPGGLVPADRAPAVRTPVDRAPADPRRPASPDPAGGALPIVRDGGGAPENTVAIRGDRTGRPGGGGTGSGGDAGGPPTDGTVAIRAVGPGTRPPAPRTTEQPPADGTMAMRALSPGTGQRPPAQTPAQPPAPAPDPRPAPAPAAPAAPAPAGPHSPLTAGQGGGAASWAQQVHQLAHPEQAAHPQPRFPLQAQQPQPQFGGRGGQPDQPVVPWKPPVEDPFQQLAQAQASARPAGLGKRFAARLVDTVVLAALVGAIGFPLVSRAMDHIDEKISAAKLSGETVTVWLVDSTTAGLFGAVLGAFLVLGVLLEALPTAKWGRTLGKRLCGLEVRDIESHEAPAFGAALRRWLVYGVLGVLVVGVVNVLWCLFDRPWRQCWHDKAAHTFVAG